MQLIGMLDSPYVRRVAVSLDLLGVPFEHDALSVFRTFEQFKNINPLVKAPSFICDDGTVLMDSTLILDYAERLPGVRRSLMPVDIGERRRILRVLGVALAACEKAVQIIYERNLRPVEKQHEPWLTRIRGQCVAGFKLLEAEVRREPLSTTIDTMNQAGLTAAVVWNFTHCMLPEIAVAKDYPTLAALSISAERLQPFVKYPHSGPGVPSQ